MKRTLMVIILMMSLSCKNESVVDVVETIEQATESNENEMEKSESVADNQQIKDEFIEYCNDRFGFCLNYPSDFIPQPEPQNGDGRTFLSEDGQVKILTWGNLYDSEFNSLETAYEYAIDTSKGQVVECQVRKNNFFVVSGEEEGAVFYQKTIQKQEFGDILSFYIRYPKEESERFDAYCEKIFKEFK